jgi:chemotaxis protein histidine kinase CheA/CheY-like chemotaxis protein
MLSEDQKRILGYFIEEAKDHLNTIEQGLLNLQATIENTEMVNEVFRAAHSVKGGAAMLGLHSIQRTSHRLEDFFKLMKEAPPQTDSELETKLLRIFDGLQEQLDQLQSPYGLSDEQGQAILSGLEPVFAETEQHLQTLLNQVPATPKAATAPAPKVSAAPAKVHPETSALQLVFQSDVPALLKDMLAGFKKPDSEATRQELMQICQRFNSIGVQFELPQWSELATLTEAAVTNTDQSFRALAPVLIKDLKRAQDLVLQGQSDHISPSQALTALVPPEPTPDIAADGDLDALLADALDTDDLESDGTETSDLADLFATAESNGAEDDSELDDSWLDQATQTEPSNVEDLEAAFDSLTSEVLDTSANRSGGRHAEVEVGDEELNSLADLFEGDMAGLEAVWEEEDAPGEDEHTTQAEEDESFSLDSDLADLLETAGSDQADATTEDDDLASLFGASFDEALAGGESAQEATPKNTEPAKVDEADFLSAELEEITPATPGPDGQAGAGDLDDFFALGDGDNGVTAAGGTSQDDFENFFDASAAPAPAEPTAHRHNAPLPEQQERQSAAIASPTPLQDNAPTSSPEEANPSADEAQGFDPFQSDDLDELFNGTSASPADSATHALPEAQPEPAEPSPAINEDTSLDDLDLDFPAEPDAVTDADLDLDFDAFDLDDAAPSETPEPEATQGEELDFDALDADLGLTLEDSDSDEPEATQGEELDFDDLDADLDFTLEDSDSSVTDSEDLDFTLDGLETSSDNGQTASLATKAANSALPDAPAQDSASDEDLWDDDLQFMDDLDGPLTEADPGNLTDLETQDGDDVLADLAGDAAPDTAGTAASESQPAAVAIPAELSTDDNDDNLGFDDLESLLDEPTPPAPESEIDAEAVPDDSFDELESLLEDDAPLPSAGATSGPPQSSAPEATPTKGGSDLDEFSDLEKLLEDTDQLGGSSPTLGARRGGAAQAARRTPRRAATVTDQTMRVSVNHLDALSNLVGELVVNRNSLEQDQERLRQFLDNLLAQVQQLNDVGQRMRDLYERSLLESSLISSRQAIAAASTSRSNNNSNSHATGATFDALEMDRFTGFHTLSQEMIELIVRVREAASDIEFTVDSSDQITRQFRQVTTQLQEGLNKARMVPFGQTADRLPRAVRDISLKCGKEARLVVEGRDTLIDKMILERLYDPVTHLVNNAITHGIETPAERESHGKSREGTITIRAFYQGNQTVIYIADDGGGINPDVVKSKALKKGLITSAEAQDMSDVEVYDLLFLPGFSTRDQADDFSGRGVGMDVVRTALSDIRGAITVESTLGQGTSFTIRLPLTLSITKALSCVNNQARIAFPMDGVEDMFDVPRERVQTNEQGVSCILWRDTLLPFRSLGDLLQFNRGLGRGRVYGGSGDENVISIVVLRSASAFIGLQVDQVIGEQEIVIKQLEGPVPKPTGIAGATVMGDGRVMPIADVLELMDLASGRVRREPTPSLWGQAEAEEAIPAADREEPTVLIVDDSITVRELLSMSFNKVGYRVEQARDGQEAWEKLRAGLPCDLVFCDIEMPRMDGLELLSRLQQDEDLSQIPIAMLTSRGADRHRQMAVDLGASGYFTKPYLEEMLLDAAQRMLNGENMIEATAASQPQEA